VEHGAVHVARFAGGEEDDRLRDLFGVGGPAKWNGRDDGCKTLAHRVRTRSGRRAGRNAVTRTPLGPYSAAHALVSSATAAFEAPYAESPGKPNSAAIVVTLMIAPPPRATIFGAIAAVSRNGALTLTAKVSSNAASESSVRRPGWKDAGVVDENVYLGGALGKCAHFSG